MTAALRVVISFGHRGATSAGVLTQVPDRFFRAASPMDLLVASGHEVGMAFLPRRRARRQLAQRLIAGCRADEGVRLLSWRDVPVGAVIGAALVVDTIAAGRVAAATCGRLVQEPPRTAAL